MDGPPRPLVGAGASLPLCSTAFYLTLFIVFYVYECFICMYVCVPQRQRKSIRSPGNEVIVVVTHHVEAGN